QAVRRQYFCADVFERGGALHRLIRRQVANDALDLRDESVRICTRVNEEVAAKKIVVFKGAIGSDHGSGNQVFVVNIGGGSPNAVRRHETPFFGSSSR